MTAEVEQLRADLTEAADAVRFLLPPDVALRRRRSDGSWCLVELAPNDGPNPGSQRVTPTRASYASLLAALTEIRNHTTAPMLREWIDAIIDGEPFTVPDRTATPALSAEERILRSLAVRGDLSPALREILAPWKTPRAES